MRILANADSGMVLVRDILAGIPPDRLAGLGALVAVPHDVVRHLTVLAVIGGAIHTPVVIPTRPTMG
jgi:hypothetical protein